MKTNQRIETASRLVRIAGQLASGTKSGKPMSRKEFQKTCKSIKRKIDQVGNDAALLKELSGDLNELRDITAESEFSKKYRGHYVRTLNEAIRKADDTSLRLENAISDIDSIFQDYCNYMNKEITAKL